MIKYAIFYFNLLQSCLKDKNAKKGYKGAYNPIFLPSLREKVDMKKNIVIFEKYIFPIILLLYPLLKINQGVDVSDSTYSLGNYLYFDKMDGMWVISTYISNVFGSLLVRLPGGHTLLGMNFYTGLFVSAIALTCYFILKKEIKLYIVFWGEILAISFCWIPTGILYNYMTYLFFTLGALFLYLGLIRQKNFYLLLAGILLGLNVMVRFPNLTEAALIVVVWYSAAMHKSVKEALQKTGICLLGYLIGFAIPLITIMLRYGVTAYTDMIQSLMGIQGTDETYSALSMVTSVLKAYARSFKWVVLILIGLVLGYALFMIKRDTYSLIKKIVFGGGIVLMLRFFWGRGMFSFRYYEDYTSMFEWGMILLYLTLIACFYTIFSRHSLEQERYMSVIVLVILCITPLGSNNFTLQNLNNLFLLAPFTLMTIVKWWRNVKIQGVTFPLRSMLTVLLIMITIQSIGFHLVFVFRDGMRGEKRDTRIAGTETIDGMYTSADNAEGLTGLISYCNVNQLTGQDALFYGDAPGLSFILKMPPAISTSWPDLDSYAMAAFHQELTDSAPSTIIMKKSSPASKTAAEKLSTLYGFINDKEYKKVYQNENYAIFTK